MLYYRQSGITKKEAKAMRLTIQKKSIIYGSILSGVLGAFTLWAFIKGITDAVILGICFLVFIWIFAIGGDSLEFYLKLKKSDY